MIFHVIGIGNSKAALAPQLQELVGQHTVFSGGRRHYELVKELLPQQHEWITISSPLEAVFQAYEQGWEQTGQPIVVFASGDPLFYGFSNTLRNRYPQTRIHSYSYFSAIQLLCSRAGINSSSLRTISVHGRSWQALDKAIVEQQALIGVLTDQDKTPATIAARLLHYGYSNYRMIVGEDLEGEYEQLQQLELPEAAQKEFHPLNCLLLVKKSHRDIPFGIDDTFFQGLEGRPNMITKMPVRLCSLHALELSSKAVLWDIGFCTGAVSIEARLRFPQLSIYAIEKRAECLQIMENNQRRLGAPGIHADSGDFFEWELATLPRPDAVFVGGHGGRLSDLLQKLDLFILPGGTVVINAVQESSIRVFNTTAKAMGWHLAEPLKLKVNTHNEISILKASTPSGV
jgi:precorrin-6Y C5,15-methyltransferase (decarboxylating)